MLRDAGFDLVELRSPAGNVPAGKIGYVFARTEINIAVWVARGLVAAGAFDDIAWTDRGSTLRPIRADLRVFLRSDPIPRAVELVRRDLDPAIRARLFETLLGVHLDPGGVAKLVGIGGGVVSGCFNPSKCGV